MRSKPVPGKRRITIRIDAGVLDWFRTQVRSTGGSYQSLINLALRDHIAREPLEPTLRRVVREELARIDARSSPHAYGYEDAPAALVADADDASLAYGSARGHQERTRGQRAGKLRSGRG